MSIDNITPIHPGAPIPDAPLREYVDGFAVLQDELTLCRQMMLCATITLGQAAEDSETSPAAIGVLEHCVERFRDFDNKLDRWYVKRIRPLQENPKDD